MVWWARSLGEPLERSLRRAAAGAAPRSESGARGKHVEGQTRCVATESMSHAKDGCLGHTMPPLTTVIFVS